MASIEGRRQNDRNSENKGEKEGEGETRNKILKERKEYRKSDQLKPKDREKGKRYIKAEKGRDTLWERVRGKRLYR